MPVWIRSSHRLTRVRRGDAMVRRIHLLLQSLLERLQLLQGGLVLTPLGFARPIGEAVPAREAMLVAARADRTPRASHFGLPTGVAGGAKPPLLQLFSSACGC